MHIFDRLHITHCSESKNPDFRNTNDSTTPDVMYISDRIKSFFRDVKGSDLPWAIFSDKYGFVFPATKIQWYDLSPDAVTDADIDQFVDEACDKLSKYEKIVYYADEKPIHRTYQQLINAMKSRGLPVTIENGL